MPTKSGSISYTHGSSTDDLSYGYDPAGRRTAVYGTYGRTSLPAATTANAVYDLANRLTSWNGATVTHDLNGNVTNDGTFAYTYNPRNQLTLVKQGNQTRGSYIYDGLGRRVSRTVGNSTTKPAYDGWNLAQERASNGSVTANYLTGLGLDQPFIRTPSSGSARYYLSDALGSIVGLASPTGTVPTTYTYEPYGKTTASGTGSDSFLGFTGRENDSTGTLSLYNYRARAYSPTLHRFITEDPIGFVGGINLYEYGASSPTVHGDPLGLAFGRCGFLGSGCWSEEFRATIDALALALAIGAFGTFLFAGGGWVIFGVAISSGIAGTVATLAGFVSSVLSLTTAQTTGQRILAGSAIATSFLFPPTGITAGIFAALWVSIVVTRYLVDEANS